MVSKGRKKTTLMSSASKKKDQVTPIKKTKRGMAGSLHDISQMQVQMPMVSQQAFYQAHAQAQAQVQTQMQQAHALALQTQAQAQAQQYLQSAQALMQNSSHAFSSSGLASGSGGYPASQDRSTPTLGDYAASQSLSQGLGNGNVAAHHTPGSSGFPAFSSPLSTDLSFSALAASANRGFASRLGGNLTAASTFSTSRAPSESATVKI